MARVMPTDSFLPGESDKRQERQKDALSLPRASKTKLARARDFRKAPTDAERQVWEILRNRQVLRLKFRRQKVIYGFIADFYCAEHALVIEVDGPIHEAEDHARADLERTRAFERAGIQVLRIRNEDIGRETLEALIHDAIRPSGPPSPGFGRGG